VGCLHIVCCGAVGESDKNLAAGRAKSTRFFGGRALTPIMWWGRSRPDKKKKERKRDCRRVDRRGDYWFLFSSGVEEGFSFSGLFRRLKGE